MKHINPLFKIVLVSFLLILPALTKANFENATACLYSTKDINSATATDGLNACPLVINHIFFNQQMCENLTDIEITPTSGVSPYVFEWTFGEVIVGNTAIFESLGPGNYGLTVTDSDCCTTVKTVTFTGFTQLIVGHGTTNNSATITVQSGMAPITYLWETGATTSTLAGVSPGIYGYTVTDGTGCTKESSAIIQNACAFSVTSAPIFYVCNGASNGVGTVSVNGGSPPYTYLWSNGETVEGVTNLSLGNYEVEVTDNIGCVVYHTLIVQERDAFSFTTSYTATTATVNSASSYLNYLWDNGQTTQTATGLSPGFHCVTVSNNGFCAESTCFISTGCPVTTSFLKNYGCGCSNSSLLVKTQGGIPPFSYQWSNGATNSTAYNLSNGMHIVTVTDSNGCVTIDSTLLTNIFDLPSMTATTSSTNATCSNTCDGSSTVILAGGSPPFIYLWSTGANTQTVTGLCPGTYSVTIADANGCEGTAASTIFDTIPISVSTTTVDVVCSSICNGSATISASNGVPPYSYFWDTGQTTSSEANLCVGTYTVTVTGANSCTSIVSFVIEGPPLISLTTSSTPVSSPGASDGTATVSTTGGTPPYSYLWDNGVTVPTTNQLTAGNHCATVTDANGCAKITCIFVGGGSMNNQTESSGAHLVAYPNPAFDVLYLDIKLLEKSNVTYRLYSIQGQLLQKEEMLNVSELSKNLNVHQLPRGIYLLRIMIGAETIVKKICLQ